jgi:cyclomaltodextrinase / maltogenic alpha-amylase / neopullulanase
MIEWTKEAVFYHAYPLGYCGAPEKNDLSSPPLPRLDRLTEDLGRISGLGFNALYLGPVFESMSHGYDPVDFRAVDRRLGDKTALARLAEGARKRGMRLVFDGVFNHTGREHPWFRALRAKGKEAPTSPEAERYASIRSGTSPFGDPFSYEAWAGHYELAKLNLRDAATKAELIGAALSWIDDYGIDGLRLDAADCLEPDFIAELAAACHARKEGFWLMGEIVAGDYRRWLGKGDGTGVGLDSVTNYECYKGLWSSLVDANYFEIAWSLKRQFGEDGLYRGVPLYSFADNHDVDRAASKLKKEAHLYPLYCLLFTMPGVPSVYYGSERGAKAKKEPHSDRPLRPTIEAALASGSQPDLEAVIRRLSALRHGCRALREGGYRELAVASESLAFERASGGERAVVALNSAASPAKLELQLGGGAATWKDALNDGVAYRVEGGTLRLDVPPTWARVLVPAG